MTEFKVVTINVLGDPDSWAARRPWLCAELKRLEPDVVALQEALISLRAAEVIAEQIGLNFIHCTEKTGENRGREAVALLSRTAFQSSADLALGSQGRVAQAVRLEREGAALLVANGHFAWHPGDSSERLAQVQRFRAWLEEFEKENWVVACGDFNGFPETRAIRWMQMKYPSAYYRVHGKEPDLTFPSPLKRPLGKSLRSILPLLGNLRWREVSFKMRGTLDYIFVDPRIAVKDCRIVLDRAAPGESGLYPSDHFGLMATLDIRKL